MNDSPIFDLVCEHVKREAHLTRLEARGTIRLLLKEVGLDPQFVTKSAALQVVERFLEPALRVRRVEDPERVKAHVLQVLADSQHERPQDEDPAAVFSRITFRS